MNRDPTREEALAHFGIKGQKWGVRNQRTPVSDTAILRARHNIAAAKDDGSYKLRKKLEPEKLRKISTTAKAHTVKERTLGATAARVTGKTLRGIRNVSGVGIVGLVGAAWVAAIVQELGETSTTDWDRNYPDQDQKTQYGDRGTKTTNDDMFNPKAKVDQSQIDVRRGGA